MFGDYAELRVDRRSGTREAYRGRFACIWVASIVKAASCRLRHRALSSFPEPSPKRLEAAFTMLLRAVSAFEERNDSTAACTELSACYPPKYGHPRRSRN